jgi:2-polyprenyl-3-methyl-5-hydroxy-6-metoxy-1,4-benzoquinol methylase
MNNEKQAATGYFVATDGAAYENFMGRWSSRLAPLFLEFAGIKAGDRVLDVGCGTGVMTHGAAMLGANAVGFDMSEQYLDYARIHRSHPNARYDQGDARSLPYPDNSFDVAVSTLAIDVVGCVHEFWPICADEFWPTSGVQSAEAGCGPAQQLGVTSWSVPS